MAGTPRIFWLVLVFALQAVLLMSGSVSASASTTKYGNSTYLLKPILTKPSFKALQTDFQKNGSQVVLSVDSGKLRGVITMYTIVQLEKQIRSELVTLEALTPEALQLAVDFRNARLGVTNSTAKDVTDEDFDIYLSDFVDTFAGGAFGSFIVTYLACNGGNHDANLNLFAGILEAQKTQSNIVSERTLVQDLQDGLKSNAFSGILPNPGTAQTLNLLLYHGLNLTLLSQIATQQQNFSATSEFNPHGDPLRASVDTSVELLDKTFNFTMVAGGTNNGPWTGPWQFVNLIVYLFGDRKFSDSSFVKSNLYIQTTDMVNTKPLAFYKFGNTFGYTAPNFTYEVGQPTVRFYDGVDQSLWKLVEASTAYFNLGHGVAVDLGAQGVTILTDSGYLAEEPQQLVLAVQERFTGVALKDCKVLSVGPAYGVITMRSLDMLAPTLTSQSVQVYAFSATQSSYPVTDAYTTMQLSQATNNHYIRIGQVFDERSPIIFQGTVMSAGSTTQDLLVGFGKSIFDQYSTEMQQKITTNAVREFLSKTA